MAFESVTGACEAVPLLCGLRVSVEGRVVGVLSLGWWDVAKTRVKPTVVVPIDPAGGRVFDVCDGLVGPVVEHGGADAFCFVEPVDGLHQRIDAPMSVNW